MSDRSTRTGAASGLAPTLAASLGWQSQPVDAAEAAEEPTAERSAPGLHCSINSFGQFTIHDGGNDTVYSPREALTMKRFLENTSILEELAARGELR